MNRKEAAAAYVAAYTKDDADTSALKAAARDAFLAARAAARNVA